VLLYEQHLVLAEDQGGRGSQRIVVCSKCGAAFTDTSIPQREYDLLYSKRSRYAAGPAAPIEPDRDVSRFRDIVNVIEEFVPLKSAPVVDIGCATGAMLAALAERGYTDLTGVDPSEECVTQTRMISGVRAYTGSLAALPVPHELWRLVILSHVLEHVRDLRAALLGLIPKIASDAVLYVEVPDAARYCEFTWSPFQDFNSEHINHFSQRTLESLLSVVGFSPLRSDWKEILSAPGMPYPAIYCVAARRAGACMWVKDHSLKERLETYIERSAAIMREIDRVLESRIAPGEPVIVWGTGELTAKLLAQTALGRARISAFVDSNPINQGRVLGGVPVVAPGAIAADTSAPIVVASVLHYESIARAARALGFGDRLVRLPDPRPPGEALVQ
jgi:SAM-dependent methyltransferase